MCGGSLFCGRAGPCISPLLFTDDSLFFFHASLEQCLQFKLLLSWYGKASGQLVNFVKSAVCFSPNVGNDISYNLVEALGVVKVNCHEKYLGLPSFAEHNKRGLFDSIRDRIWKRLNNWKSKFFSMDGRKIPIKPVIQSIPTYTMSLFKLPKLFIKDIHVCSLLGGRFRCQAQNALVHLGASLQT